MRRSGCVRRAVLREGARRWDEHGRDQSAVHLPVNKLKTCKHILVCKSGRNTQAPEPREPE